MKDMTVAGGKKTTIERRYVRFGKFDLNHFKLDDNILLIKYPVSRAPVPKIKSTKISDEFQALIRDLMDTQKINTFIQKRLGKAESELFGLLIRLAGLTEQLEYKKQVMTIDDYIHRFNILKGELSAGNDSRIMKNELMELIDILNKAGKISDIDATEFIDLLKI
jgi:hypothetical protein